MSLTDKMMELRDALDEKPHPDTPVAFVEVDDVVGILLDIDELDLHLRASNYGMAREVLDNIKRRVRDG